MKKYGLPEESYVLMGDYLEYSLQEAKKHNFRKKGVEFLNSLGINVSSGSTLPIISFYSRFHFKHTPAPLSRGEFSLPGYQIPCDT